MSHQLIAAIWESLQDRNDISNLLQEIIGEYTLALLHHSDYSVPTIANALRPVIWIKTIVDLQQAYLQATSGASECAIPGLLSGELVCSTLRYLLHVKTKLFPVGGSQSGRDWAAQHTSLVHTLLSGLRLLLLRNEHFAPERLRQLEESMAKVWFSHRELPECEFVVHEIFPEALDTDSPTEDQAGLKYAMGLRSFGVPTFAGGLYPLYVQPMKLVSQTFPKLNSDVNWLRWYWNLFDTIHACECALVQVLVDHRRPSNGPISPISPIIPSTDIIAQLQNAR